jgi:hypothetical protein
VAWLHGGADREEAAMEADDIMATLLAGYLSNEDDTSVADMEDGFEVQPEEENVQSSTAHSEPCLKGAGSATVCNMAIYSDDSDEEDIDASTGS